MCNISYFISTSCCFRFSELQSWWQVPGIAYFCSLFKDAFSLPEFDIDVSNSNVHLQLYYRNSLCG